MEIQRIESDHPQAVGTPGGSGLYTGRYWQITPNVSANGTFSATLTLLHDNLADPSVCKHTSGSNWNCDRAGFDAASVWRSGIDSFSDWAVGDAIAASATPVVTTPISGTITNDAQPTFAGTAVANNTVTVYDESASVICTATADSSGDWSCAPASPLPD
ncbi:MAG: Ig-like domain-containing protein, partial [Anaerolineae bacterium]